MAQMHTRLGNLMKQSGRYSLHTEEVIRRKHNNWTYSTFRKYVPKSWETIHQIVYLRMPRGRKKALFAPSKGGFLGIMIEDFVNDVFFTFVILVQLRL